VRTHLSISPRARRWKFLTAAASVGVVAAALTSPAAAAAPTATAPPKTAGSGAPSAAADLFASQVETLGVEQYPATFAGATLEPTGVTDVYAVAASDAGLVSAVEALDTQGYPVKVIAVNRSYSQLMAISDKLLGAYSHLQAKGISLSEFGPDPSSGTVTVTVQKPTASDMSALASARGAPVTSSNYNDEASAVLKQQVGAGITLQSQSDTGYWDPVARDSDTPAYYDGDLIYHVATGVTCTSGFNLVAPSGSDWMVTAGHCANGIWKTHAATMGSTGINYLLPASAPTTGNDFQLTYLSGGGLGVTWVNGSNVAPVSGALFPAVGAAITFNGGVTGELRGNTVTGTTKTLCSKADPTNPYTKAAFCATNQTVASNPNGAIPCHRGDSGGPVYQHTNGSDVKAVGTITFAFYTGSGAPLPMCSATQIDHIVYITGYSLITSH
jgi:Trypsin